MLLGDGAGERGRRGRAAHGTGQDLDDDVVRGRRQQAVADLGAELQRADRRKRQIEGELQAVAGAAGDRLGHGRERRELPGVVGAR